MALEGKGDQLKGKIKEAAGDLTDNKSLENEGKADQLGGDAKEKAAGVRDAVEDKVNDVAADIQERRDR